jgi:hypothetical protein
MSTDEPWELSANAGPCCCCGRHDETVRNVVMMARRAPVPGYGWGCFQCGLPMDGAYYVACDDCADIGRPPVEVCEGYPAEKKRIPFGQLGDDVFDHDMSKHPEAPGAHGVPIKFEDSLLVGRNSHGYTFGVGRVGRYWLGYAIGGGMIFILPGIDTGAQLGLLDVNEAMLRVGAIAQDPAHAYGGIEEWFVAESLRGDPEAYRCGKCGEVCCGGDCDRDDFEDDGP